MTTNSIIYKSKEVEKGISVAGTFNQWSPEPMLYNSPKEYYEYVLKKEKLVNVVKILFKFINNQTGVWFTDDNFSITQDEHGNSNNVMLITPAKESKETKDTEVTSLDDVAQPAKSMTPVVEVHDTPAPTPKVNLPSNQPADEVASRTTGEVADEVADGDTDKAIDEFCNTKNDSGSAIGIEVSDKNHSTIQIEVPDAELNKNNEITKRGDQDIDYKNVLQKIVMFIKNIFMSWVNWFRQ